MDRIYWNDISFFTPGEFTHDPSIYAKPQLIYTLDQFRLRLGEKIYPSPAEGAFVRFNGSENSQHYVGQEKSPIRKSTAIDIFPEGIPINVFLGLMNLFFVKGIGIYLDTTGIDGKPWIMFHMDIREKGFKSYPLIWFCVKENGKNSYYYPQNNSEYWSFLKDERMYIRKEFGTN